MRRWLRLILQVASLILFGLILIWSGPEAWHQVAGGDRKDILISLLLLGAASMLSAVRLQLVAHGMAQGRLAAWPRFYHLTMTTRAIGLVVPRSLSTVGGKTLGLSALGVTARRAIWIVLVDSGFDVTLLAAFGAPALLLLQFDAPSWAFAILLLVVLLALGIGLWWLTDPGRLQSLPRWVAGLPLLASVFEVPADNAPVLFMPRRTALEALGLTILFNTLLGICYHFIARAVGVVNSSILFIVGFPITQLSLIVAVTPGGLGLVEAGWYGVLLLGGIQEQEALAFVIGQRAYLFIYVLIWAGVSVLLAFIHERSLVGQSKV